MKKFKEKIVWITGASSGIGEALAHAFAREGAFLVLSSRNKEKLENVRSRCLNDTSKCWIYPVDLSNANNLDGLVASVMKQTGRIDILINNAGRSQRSFARDTPLDIDRTIMELNFFSKIALTKLILPQMLRNKRGHIVVISSITGKFGFPMRTAYSASKHAVQGYFESLRAELTNDNIAVTIVSPGRVKTSVSLNAITSTGESYKKMDEGQERGMPADECAIRIIQAIKKEKKDVLIGKKEVIMVYVRRFLPGLYHKLITGIKN